METTLRELKDFASTALELKHKDAPGDAVSAAAVQGSLLLLRCREHTRQAALEADRMRAKASGQREDLDQATLQLHNLVYEQQYYDKEISSKRTFQPSVPDDKLCCISSQDFLQVQQQQNPQQKSQSGHEVELARLNYELGQRKQLKAHLQRLLQQKQRAQTELNAARDRIDELRGHMEAIKSSSRSLMETSLPESAAVSRNREAAELLPLPLYIIYSQVATASGVLGLPASAEIAGSTTAAEQLAATEASAKAADATPADAVQAAKRRRKSEAQDDHAYKLSFQYYTQLKLVGVAAATADDEELLTDLFLGDAGDGLLLESVAAACSSGHTSLDCQAGHDLSAVTPSASAAGERQREVGGDDDALMLDEGEVVFMEEYEEAYEQGTSYKAASEAGEASAVSEEAGQGAAEVASAADSAEQTLLARHSMYRLVLRSSALEAHCHVKVFLAYPLCPPVFVVTRLLDIRDARGGSSKGSVALTAVNEVLRLEQQVGGDKKGY
ncbi:Fms-interacting protein-domain-containing protein [Scenedesmus sp. NREL 46B-D3]|nr:Fms-interacting protein-domain-containing protein [Scenedesmus sp. NREL 46B-D3]